LKRKSVAHRDPPPRRLGAAEGRRNLVMGIHGGEVGVKRKISDSKRRRESESCDIVGDLPSCGAKPRTCGGDLSPLKEQ
jgi:hypothetical protein